MKFFVFLCVAAFALASAKAIDAMSEFRRDLPGIAQFRALSEPRTLTQHEWWLDRMYEDAKVDLNAEYTHKLYLRFPMYPLDREFAKFLIEKGFKAEVCEHGYDTRGGSLGMADEDSYITMIVSWKK